MALQFIIFLILIPAVSQAMNSGDSDPLPEGLSVSDWHCCVASSAGIQPDSIEGGF
jgi:hypothetical protein